MRIRMFQHVVSAAPCGDPAGNFLPLEKKINAYLEQNPGVRVVDVKLTSHAAPVGDRVTNYGLVAVVIYEEKT
jgi:hypothetical protein